MYFKSKKVPLIMLGAVALICSRMLFFFFNDTEGPNLLIVVALATVLFFLSVAAYVFSPSKINGFTRLSLAIFIQVLSVAGLYLCLK